MKSAGGTFTGIASGQLKVSLKYHQADNEDDRRAEPELRAVSAFNKQNSRTVVVLFSKVLIRTGTCIMRGRRNAKQQSEFYRIQQHG
jgi:hypothetical protein